MTSLRRISRLAAPLSFVLAAGCGQLRAASSTPPVPLQWQFEATLHEAEREVLATRFGVADRLLADFAARNPGTHEAAEAGFWRAVFKLDAANTTASPRDAVTLLDDYLLAPATAQHRGSATTLRRVASALDARGAALVSTPSTPSSAPSSAAPRSESRAEPRAETRAEERRDERRDEELQRLREELAKANAELERIRKRLAQPTP
jgi:hypothetical protein